MSAGTVGEGVGTVARSVVDETAPLQAAHVWLVDEGGTTDIDDAGEDMLGTVLAVAGTVTVCHTRQEKGRTVCHGATVLGMDGTTVCGIDGITVRETLGTMLGITVGDTV